MTENREMHPDAVSLATPVRLMDKMNHDLRNPLAAIITTSSLFIEGAYGSLTLKQRQAIERIEQDSARILRMLDEFITYVKAEAGELALAPAPFDPRSALAALVDQLRPAAEKRLLALNLTVSDSIPVRFEGDEAAISRVLLALLWNAISFTAQGSVSLTADWLPDGEWLITVRDTGPGIAPKDIPYIFEPFWRGPFRPQTLTSGCGLGLAMARAVTKAMKGLLTLGESSPAGSTFVLRVPPAAA